MNEQLLAEARRIGDFLLEKAKQDSGGTYWETMTMDTDRNMSFKVSEGIYSGTSGIVLFLMELFKKTDDRRYCDAGVEAMKWVENYCRANPSNYSALVTGRMGAAFTMMRMKSYTGDDAYLEKALEIAKPAADIVQTQQMIDDYINGSSGTLLGFLHLHAATGEAWVLEAVERYIEHLLMSAQHGPRGLYWDRSNNGIGGLCGFSHGAAGIGFVFLEAGRYLQNESLYHIAEQAFLYERYRFDAEKKNWPDLRKGIYNDDDRKEHEEAYLSGNLSFFTTPGDMNAWCHGAAGIGLSRLRAYELLGKELYREEAKIAIEKTTITDVETDFPQGAYIMCHGGGGNADLFLEAFRLWGDESCLEKAKIVAQKAITSYEQFGHYLSGYRIADNKEEDTSLFMGNAGIGYFMLRTLDPHGVPSVTNMPLANEVSVKKTAAGIDLSAYRFISGGAAELQLKLLDANFHRSSYVLQKVSPESLEAFYEGNGFSIEGDFTLNGAFVRFVEELLPGLPQAKRDVLADIFKLELRKLRIDEAVVGHSFISIKDLVNVDRGKEILERTGMTEEGGDLAAFKALTLKLDPDVVLETARWNWAIYNRDQWDQSIEEGLAAEPVDEPDDNWAILLRPIPTRIVEVELSPFSYTILEEFYEPNTVEAVIKATIDAFESLTPEQEEILEKKIIEQIRQVLMSGILLEPSATVIKTES